MKALMIVCDGIADRPVPELGNHTPLEVAKHPNMDELAKHGVCGLMDPIAPGIPPGSDTAHLALLGYDPYEVYMGRGSFEAAGAGLEVRAGDVALRVNYATVDRKLVVLDRRAGRIRDTKPLEAAIQRVKLTGADFLFKSTAAHRATLVLRGKGLSHEVSDSDPHKTGVNVLPIKALSGKALKTARLLNDFSRKTHELLSKHPLNKERIDKKLFPANYLLMRGAGIVPPLEPLKGKFGLSGACVAAAALVKGVCRVAGMEIIEVPGSTTGADTNLDGEIDAVIRALEEHDFVLYNIKGFDEMSHDGNFKGKVEFIERVDKALGRLLDVAELTVLTADHTTPASARDHSGDPVPWIIAGAGVRPDGIVGYDECSAARGGMGRIRGKDLLPTLVDLMGKSKKFGA